MQIDTSNTVQVSSNLPAPDSTMTLDQDGLVHLMSVLTNLYSDKHLAVLREYSTNARDAHVAAGREDDPILVTLPTSLNPTLVISDHGTGLSREELLGIYSRYGASSKRETNLQVGSFGLGSKSAFTISGQFIVTARRNGQQVSAVFAMNASGIGTVNILAEHDTTEANGVTVSIPVAEPSKMQAAAAKFFRAWQPGTVLVDGQTPDNFYSDPEALWLSEDILYTRKGGITVVMGSVAYPLPSSAVQEVRRRTSASWPTYGEASPGLLIEVPIGAVDITPSRESIRDTERSLQAVSAVLRKLPDALRGKLSAISAKDEITRVFASRRLLSAANHLNVQVSSALPARIDLPKGQATLFGTTSRGGLRTEDYGRIEAETAHLITVLIGVPAKRSAKRHAKAWIEENSRRSSLIMFGDGTATEGQTEWFRYGTDSPVQTVHFDDIELPASESSSRERQALLYQTSSGLKTPKEIIADGRPVAYANHPSGHAALSGYLTVRLTTRQRTDTFLRRVPGAVSAAHLIAEHGKAQLKALGDLTDLINAYFISRQVERITYVLDDKADKITHPAWVTAKSAAATYRALSSEEQALVRQNTKQADEKEATAPLYQALPLLKLAVNAYGRVSPQQVKHLIAYANTQAS